MNNCCPGQSFLPRWWSIVWLLLSVCLVDHCVTGKWKFKTKPWSWFPFAPVVRNLERNNNSHIYLTEVGVLLFFLCPLKSKWTTFIWNSFPLEHQGYFVLSKRRMKSYYPSRANTSSWASFSRSAGVHSSYTNHHPHLCILQSYLDWLQHFLLSLHSLQ